MATSWLFKTSALRRKFLPFLQKCKNFRGKADFWAKFWAKKWRHENSPCSPVNNSNDQIDRKKSMVGSHVRFFRKKSKIRFLRNFLNFDFGRTCRNFSTRNFLISKKFRDGRLTSSFVREIFRAKNFWTKKNKFWAKTRRAKDKRRSTIYSSRLKRRSPPETEIKKDDNEDEWRMDEGKGDGREKGGGKGVLKKLGKIWEKI